MSQAMDVAWLNGLTLGAALRLSASRHADLECIKSGDTVMTFAEFDQSVDRLASGFLSLGLGRGDHVAVWLTNSIEWAQTFCACGRIGAVLVPINTRYTSSEAGYILAQSDARLLVMTRSIWNKDYVQMLESIAPDIANAGSGLLQLAQLPQLRHVLTVGEGGVAASLRFEELARTPVTAALAQAEAAVTPQDPLLICYTSGTTGRPKGAMHNHIVIKQATRVGLSCNLSAGGRVLGHMPLYHVAGLYMGLVPSLTLGGCFVVMPQWDTGEALALMESEKISFFGGIPTHFIDLVDHPSLPGRDLSSLTVAWMGGTPVMQVTFERFKKALGLKHLLSTYGMTENTISTTFNRPEDPPDASCNNCAPVLGECEVRVVDPATGAERPTGEIGEIWCRGETVMMGYYKNPQATAEAITPEGWLKTGDLGRIDANGMLGITGRVKEMYKTGGTNVYPAEVEQHLSRHPAVKMAVVVGVEDERLGEVGHAFIELNPGTSIDLSEVHSFCKGSLADYKIPRHVTVLPELPRTSTGKIQKVSLVQMAREGLAGARG
ncbi:MAG: AMP-binding protein [Burkholderiaceae bacterium]|nr:AMP-binding protein [Burkholderiaceae bacterium]MDO9090186.1 AMP-binding protein [Burkholderiaceae bacterium]